MNLPDDVTIQVAGSGDKIDESTGQIVGAWSGTTPSPILGTDVNAYSAPVGAVIEWRTDEINNGRRLQGHTFIVPLAGGCFSSTGDVLAARVSDLQGFANTLVTAAGGTASPHWAIYSPRYRTFGIVTSAIVRRKAAVLRSRRD